jgi:hypothetical protein
MEWGTQKGCGGAKFNEIFKKRMIFLKINFVLLADKA